MSTLIDLWVMLLQASLLLALAAIALTAVLWTAIALRAAWRSLIRHEPL